MILAWITLLVGLIISATSGYFSIIGLGQLFAHSFWSVVIMGCAIELGKIMAATWLHSNWYEKSVSFLHKTYLTLALVICMSITGLGTFGFLSKAHIDQQAPVIEQLTAEKGVSEQIKSLQDDLDRLQKNLDSVNELSKGKNNNSLDVQRSRILKQMDKDRKQLQDLNSELLKLKKTTSNFSLELGPAKYLADVLFGDGEQNIDRAVQIFILMIMSVFDPLALILIISANHTFRRLATTKKIVLTHTDETSVKPATALSAETQTEIHTDQIEITENEVHPVVRSISKWFRQ